MKITKSQLKQIIREELENIVEGPDLDNDGQSNAKEAYQIAFANYAEELITQKFEKARSKFNPNRYDPESERMLFNIENEVIDELSNMISGYVRKSTEKLVPAVDALRNPSRRQSR